MGKCTWTRTDVTNIKFMWLVSEINVMRKPSFLKSCRPREEICNRVDSVECIERMQADLRNLVVWF